MKLTDGRDLPESKSERFFFLIQVELIYNVLISAVQ